MDTDQGSTDKERQAAPDLPDQEVKTPEKPQREIKLPISMPTLSMPKMPREGLGNWLRNKLKEYHRVLKITKKPDAQEFKAIVKASGLGIIIIGTLGFIIHMIVQGIQLLS